MSQQQVYLEACKKEQVTPNSAVKEQVTSQCNKFLVNICACQLSTDDQPPAKDIYDLSANMVGDRGALPLLDAIGMDITFQELSLR